MKRRVAIGLAAVLVTVAAGFSVGNSPARADTAEPAVQLLAQTPWLEGPGEYGLQIGLPGVSGSDRLQVTVYDQLITRTAFDAAAAGHVNDFAFYQQVHSVTGLPADQAGGVDVQLPVNQAPPSGDPYPTVQIGETGVFPVQVALFDSSGSPIGAPLTTFIVYALHSQSAGAIVPLSAAVVIPFSSAPKVGPRGGLASLPAAETTRLQQLAAALNADSTAHASVLASPITLAELGASASPAARSALQNLTGSTRGGLPLQILPTSYSPVALGDLPPGEVSHQLGAASSMLQSVFGAAPDPTTWVVDGPLDAATLGALVVNHATQIVVPNGDLTPLSKELEITFGGSTYLDYGGSRLTIVAADQGLTADFTGDPSPVVAANHLLAELAMIYTEAPYASTPRGVAVLPPSGWSASPVFVSTLLNGLQGNPLVSAVTASSLFSVIGAPQGARDLTNQVSPNTPVNIDGTRAAIDSLRAELGPSSEVQTLEQDLLLAESDSLSPAQRAAVLGAIGRAIARGQRAVSLPPATSITLTATRGQVPITILTTGNLHPTVEMVLRSQRLIFRPFSPRGGECRVETETTEVCTLSLVSQNTTLKVPVETRSSGVFPLDVYLYPPGTPSSARLLGWPHDQDTVRSTAVSGAAVIVIVVALLALVVWWGRDLRRGRRPKGMAPAPVAAPRRPGVGDPVIDGFFDQEPPEYGPGAMSPSGVPAGPSDTTERYGESRETGD